MADSDHALPIAVVGTAGHIDHGKSALVKALTNIDPDRLPEEKKRGITIQLGYAFLDLPSGLRVSIVDVPGHERFVKTMAQGASMIQICMLAVDAGEGVKPQTVEHLHILRSMGVRRGVIVLTKCDNADEDLQALAEEEVRELTAGTFLEDAPVVRTSAVSGRGLDELGRVLDGFAGDVGEELRRMPVRVPVDRVFTVSGFGTVVTGTLMGGRLKEGEDVAIMPSERTVKIRGIEVHDVKAQQARAPCRIALNLTGVEASSNLRGTWVTAPGFFRESDNVLARVEGMPWLKKDIKLPAWLSVNIGSGDFACRMFAPGRLRSGETIFARIALSQKIIARTGDRFVLRLPGGMAGGYSTVAGGVIIDPLLRGRKVREQYADLYKELESMTDEAFIAAAVSLAGRRGVERQEIMLKVPAPPKEIEKILGKFTGQRKVIKARGALFFDHRVFEDVMEAAGRALDEFHAKRSELIGIKRDELQKLVRPAISRKLLDLIVENYDQGGKWNVSGDLISRAGFEPTGDEITLRIAEMIMREITKKPSSPPAIKELPGITGESRDQVQRGISLLATSGKARVVDGEFVYSSDFLEKFTADVKQFFEKNEQMKIGDLKDIAGVSRKYALPLARWIDNEGITLRRGEIRVRRSS